MSTTTLEVTRDTAVARVFLNRPDVRNAFNDGVIAELAQTFNALAADTSLRCIVLGGRGKAFCAGADLSYRPRSSRLGLGTIALPWRPARPSKR